MSLSPKTLDAYLRTCRKNGMNVTSIKSSEAGIELGLAPVEPDAPDVKDPVDPEMAELMEDPIVRRMLRVSNV